MPWANYQPANIYKGVPSTTFTDLTLRPFGDVVVPANTKVIINSVIVANTTGSGATITLAHVSGSQADRILSSTTVPAYSVLKLDGLNIIMEPGDRLRASQSMSNALHLHINGAVVT